MCVCVCMVGKSVYEVCVCMGVYEVMGVWTHTHAYTHPITLTHTIHMHTHTYTQKHMGTYDCGK